MRELGRQLRKACGAGGTVKDDVIEVQGDQRDKVAAELDRLGYRVKFAGG
jgi:translation initiation factor 1